MDHEGLLLALARGHQGIQPLLETFFNFLGTRTDFFHILEEGNPLMGFAVAAAEVMIAEAFGRAQLAYRLANQKHLLPPLLRNKSLQGLQEMTREINSRIKQSRIQYASPISRLAVVSSLPDMSQDEAAAAAAAAAPAPAPAPAPKTLRTSKAAETEIRAASAGAQIAAKDGMGKQGKGAVSTSSFEETVAAAAAEKATQEAKKPDTARTAASSSSSSVRKTKGGKQASFINPWNGAILDRYVWSQSINESTCQLRLLELLQQKEAQGENPHQNLTELNSKLLSVTLKDDCVRVSYEGVILFEGKWCHPVQSSESYWVLEQKTFLLFSLEKKKELWWDCLIQGDPKIDTTKVESVKKVEDFDEATQGHIRKLVFEQRLKMQGLKTPEEIQQENLLRQAWDMEGSPFKGQPFDPSVLKPQNFGPDFSGLLP